MSDRVEEIRERVADDGKRTAYYVGPFSPNEAIDDIAHLLGEVDRLRERMEAQERQIAGYVSAIRRLPITLTPDGRAVEGVRWLTPRPVQEVRSVVEARGWAPR